ncbi:MAG: efflux RND transporter periplasmic adaptor subunit [Deltaproteobacteria bacterium]|nr:MAG: efflux RND transporter periplasmic adaptor subunit [Deltaproteobacteria bacterium]
MQGKSFGQRMFDLLFWGVGVFALVTAVYLFRVSQMPKKKGGKRRGGFKFNVKTIAAEKGAIAETLRLVGNIEPLKSVTLHSEVEGVVSRVKAREGATVRRGSAVVFLDRTDLVLKLKKQRALIDQAKASERRMLATFRRDKDLWRRASRLFKTKHISEREWIDARFKKEASQAGLAEIKAQVALRKVELNMVLRDMRKSLIRAPFPARIKQLHVERGRMLRKGDAIADLVSDRGIEVRLLIPPSHISQVNPGMKVWLTVNTTASAGSSGNKKRHLATITRLSAVADPMSRNRQAILRIKEAPKGFVPGLPVEANVIVREKNDALVVPKDALIRSGGGWVVFQVKGGKALRVPVETLAEDGSRVEISGKVTPGAAVVFVGNEALFPFAPVRVISGPGAMPRRKRPQKSARK